MPDKQPVNPKLKSSRSTGKKPVAPDSTITPLSDQAQLVAEELHLKLDRMLNAAALMRANRRRATAIDRVDFEAAFDDVVNPAPRPKRLALIGDLCGIFGAGFVGYSINIDTGSGSPASMGHVAILAGLILSVVGACLKYLDPSK